MTKKYHSLGSAKEGAEHWWQQRVSAIAIVLLSLYVVSNFFGSVAFGSYDDAIEWLSSPFSATLVILFIAAAFYHAALGLQVVVEDYVHGEAKKIVLLLLSKFLCVTFAVLGILSVVKILFWSLLPHA
jgi:succinate dehydrogenase / fumarate reductase membrane anchor subunit